MADRLLPCPFCGGEPIGSYGLKPSIKCVDCSAEISVSIPFIFTNYLAQKKHEEAKAIDAWNRRAPPPAPQVMGDE